MSAATTVAKLMSSNRLFNLRPTHNLTVTTTIPNIENLREVRNKKNLTRFFIRNQKTTTTEAEDSSKGYENWYLSTLLNNVNSLTDVELTGL